MNCKEFDDEGLKLACRYEGIKQDDAMDDECEGETVEEGRKEEGDTENVALLT